MGINTWKVKLLSVFVALVFVFGIMPIAPVQAANIVESDKIPSLTEFISTIKKSDSYTLTGVYVNNILALRVVQQYSTYSVSSEIGTATRFGMASEYGSIGLLAHNYLSGGSFSKLSIGSEIILVYGDGKTTKYQVTAIRKYQALSPTNVYSRFINLDKPNVTFSSDEVINENYGSRGKLILQTCISNDGNLAWGRLFIIASPVE